MNTPYWFFDLVYWSIQIAVLALAAGLLPHLFKIRQPRVLLIYWRALIAVSLLLPFVQPWHRAELLDTINFAPRIDEFTPIVISTSAPKASHLHLPSLQLTAEIIGLIILTGIAARFIIFALGLLKLRQFRLASSTISNYAESSAVLDEMRARVNTDGEFRLSSDVDSPVTFGLSAPVILLPERFPTLDAQYQSAIACHELIHVRRRDWAHHLSEEILRAALWFHPAIAWLISRIRLSREQVVDLEVVKLTDARKPYLEALLEFTNSRSLAAVIPAPPFLVERQLAARVALVLKEVRMSRTRLIASLAAIVACLTIVATIAVWTFPLKAAPRAAQNPPLDGIINGVVGGVTSGVVNGVVGGIVGGVSGGVQAGVSSSGTSKGVIDGVPGGIEGGIPGQDQRLIKRRIAGPIIKKPIRPVTIDGQTQPPAAQASAPAKSAATTDSRFIGKFQYIPPAAPSTGKFHLIPPVGTSSPQGLFIGHPSQPPAATNRGIFQTVAPVYPADSRNRNSQSATGQVYRAGANGVTMPVCEYCPKPEYSEEARSENFSGTVYLQVVVLKDGRAGEIKVIKPLGKGLDEQAISVVRDKWTFKPAVDSNGDPVDVTVPIEIAFQLYPPPSAPSAVGSQNPPPPVPPPAATNATPHGVPPPPTPPAQTSPKVSEGMNVKIFTGPVSGSGENTPFYMGRVKTQTLDSPNPPFPRLASQRKLTEGIVTLSIILDTEGKVISAQVVKSSDPIFDKPALDTARKWKITGTHDGVPVTFQLTVEMTFKTM